MTEQGRNSGSSTNEVRKERFGGRGSNERRIVQYTRQTEQRTKRVTTAFRPNRGGGNQPGAPPQESENP
ncbi:MAG: hypothetical protein DWI29_03760 [Planctomycetota bacterium]|nr:MAG: hypothetical protein DWI29_03760 [Planctomycetota bacterium]